MLPAPPFLALLHSCIFAEADRRLSGSPPLLLTTSCKPLMAVVAGNGAVLLVYFNVVCYCIETSKRAGSGVGGRWDMGKVKLTGNNGCNRVCFWAFLQHCLLVKVLLLSFV